MTSNDVLSMYENLAGLTSTLATAAKAGDYDAMARIETQIALQAASATSGVPQLEGAPRMRKIDLLKQIMANDRAVREVTEPWKLADVMATH